ncbi:helix-hairpin-helix domain-containing protein [Halalkalicoccus sp. NIPERK01]|uniref:helix-hairpin-helix domain-containing protein n=1 Tax=Halalkalicoccus sp. NIPERK01 TaxID=3053469 RepID=UPI00256F1607|nr:helix-hairpin-helix domain-containing protein [Halalkalicoccus sp. NIPERK01]
MKRVRATVDDREPASLVRAVRDHPDVEVVEVTRLPAGDVAIGEVGIERKTLRDYIGSTMGRAGPDLRDQVGRLRTRYDHPYVLLEANLADLETLRTGVSGAELHGSMASIIARTGVPVMPCGDRERLVDLAVRLGWKHVEEPSARRLPAGAITARDEPTAKRMYGCIEGIGPELAGTLYEAYPSVSALAEASVEELLALEGIGEARARRIVRALRDGV